MEGVKLEFPIVTAVFNDFRLGLNLRLVSRFIACESIADHRAGYTADGRSYHRAEHARTRRGPLGLLLGLIAATHSTAYDADE